MGYRDDIRLINLPKHRKVLISRVKMRLLLNIPRSIRQTLFYGKRHYCPICHSHVRGFESFGYDLRIWCPVCGSIPRHRLAWLFLSQRTDLFDGAVKKMLHIAPERALQGRFARIPHLEYLSADLRDRNCMINMDITDIHYPDNTFDVVYCSHVLEHVPDDRQAIRELARVLKPKGWAVFMVPLSEQATVEDASITSRAERERVFGQYDHVRQYGPDFKDRLEACFRVIVIMTSDIASPGDTLFMGLPMQDSIFFCVKEVS